MIRFTYRLKGAGWAVASVGGEHGEISVPASYLCDALRDLVDAVQSLFTTASAECLWEEEPGEVLWRFRRQGDRLALQVLRDKEEIFSGDDDLLHFSSEVDRELRKLLDDWGIERYLKEWEYPFPHEAHRKLGQAITAEQKRRMADAAKS